MPEPEDELTPLPEDPEEQSKPSRSPYIGLGVAAIVVSTVFATVAALASTRDEAAPAPQSKDTIQTSSPETYTTDPTETSAPGSSKAKKPKKSGESSTTTTTSGADGTTGGDEGTTTGGGGSTTSRTTTTRTTTNPPPPPPNKSPIAVFTPPSCVAGTECQFDGGASSDPDGSIASYSWSFGATGETAKHTFSDAGTVEITLTVTDNKGAKNSVKKSVTVAAPSTTSGN
jgi:PKD domain